MLQMRYDRVCLEAFGYTLPEEIVTSDEIEQRLEPLYERLKLPAGRLELMTGIQARRFWATGTLPSSKSIESAEKALRIAGVDKHQIGALVHGSVCRDYLEPATACVVHKALGLPSECMIYDVSNACLGFLNGLIQIANLIELGQIRAGLVVATEGSRQLVESTIDALNRDTSLSRNDIKLAVASLTIGSGSVAAVLVDKDISQTGNRLLGGVARTNTEQVDLCHSGRDESVAGDMKPLMTTDSERLMSEGISLARGAFADFLEHSGWDRDDIHKTICHQVGVGHRKRLLEALELDSRNDFSSVEFLGNTGSVALPITMAMAIEKGQLDPRDHVALLGIGSGINVLMLALQWQRSLVEQSPAGDSGAAADHASSTPAK